MLQRNTIVDTTVQYSTVQYSTVLADTLNSCCAIRLHSLSVQLWLALNSDCVTDLSSLSALLKHSTLYDLIEKIRDG